MDSHWSLYVRGSVIADDDEATAAEERKVAELIHQFVLDLQAAGATVNETQFAGGQTDTAFGFHQADEMPPQRAPEEPELPVDPSVANPEPSERSLQMADGTIPVE